MNAAAITESAAGGDGSGLGDLVSVREMLDFLAQNRLEAVRIDVSEDEAQSNSECSDDGDAAAASTSGARTARRKFVLRRRRNRDGPNTQALPPPLSPSSAPATGGGDQSNALSDLASVTEMLDFLAQNGLEGVRIEPSNDDDDASSDDDDGAVAGNPAKKSRLHDLANVRELLEFLAQNRLERVRIEIPSVSSSNQNQNQKKTTKKRQRSAAVLAKDRDFAKTVYYKTLVSDDDGIPRSLITGLGLSS